MLTRNELDATTYQNGAKLIRPWFPQSDLFRAASELLRADGDESAAVWQLYTRYPELTLPECRKVLREAACQMVTP